MGFILTEEQEAIRKAARDFARERAPLAHFRRLRDERDGTGFSREVWRELAELGLVGAAVAIEHGGAGLGFVELGLVLEELGRTLAPTPLLSTVVLGAGALELAGTDAQRARELPAVCAGERLLAFAHEERTRHLPYDVALAAERVPGGFRLRGEKTFVLDGHVADAFVVVARTAGAPGERDGIGLFLVDAYTPGIATSRTHLVDARNAARVRFDGAVVSDEAALGDPERGADALDALLDRARIAIAAEMLGGAAETFERTLAYLRERRQFGVPIGSFQALKHRAAHLFCEIELTKSIVAHALEAIDARAEDLALLASTAKARASDTFLAVAAEGIQMHGGIGVTDEHDVGLFYKRARVAELTFGDAAFHRDRFARLTGY